MYRPAGMSDDEEEDYNDFSFGNDHHVSSKFTKAEEEFSDSVPRLCDFKEELVFESRIIKTCITGNMEMLQDYHEQHDVDKYLYTGWTLLLYATSSVQPEVVEYLLHHKADPNMHKDGFTPLMALCNSIKGTAGKSLRCLTLLIEANVDVNAVNKHRETALMYACKSQDAEFVAKLITHVTKINACDSDGKSALSYAAAANKLDIVKILLENNINISLVDKYGLSAKDIADTKEFKEISVLLTKDEEEISTFCEISEIENWKDLFPDLYPRNKKALDHDISIILDGMGLQEYGVLFQEMDLKTFLQLTDMDLSRLGIDITVHKEQFLQNLERFHSRKWHLNSLGLIKKSNQYTIYDAIIALTNAKKHISVIASSFQYIKNNWIKATNENVHLSAAQKMDYEKELKEVQNTLRNLKNELVQVKKLAKKIDKESDIGVPATFISSKKSNFNYSAIILSVTVMIGLYFCKMTCVQNS